MGTPRTPDLSAKPQAHAWLLKHPETHQLVNKVIDFLEPFRIDGCEYGWYDNKENPVFKYGKDKAEGRLSIRCLVAGCRIHIPLQESLLPNHLQGLGEFKNEEYRTHISFTTDGDNTESFKLLLDFVKTNFLNALIYQDYQPSDFKELSQIANDETLETTQRKALIDARVGQGKFRESLLNYWEVCAITGCDFKPLLKASHIKPWRVANNSERLDKHNGLLLSANLDELFDKGYISFENSGSIIFSEHFPSYLCSKLGISNSTKINVDENHASYLDFHRNEIFKS